MPASEVWCIIATTSDKPKDADFFPSELVAAAVIHNSMSRRQDALQRGGLVDDARFAAMHKDPRFSRFPKKKSTVAIDSRFSGEKGINEHAHAPC